MSGGLPKAYDDYFAALADADRDQAIDVVLGRYEAGVPVATLVRDVLVPAQREVGRRWETGAWSVSDEHAASAITEAAVSALGYAGRSPTAGPSVVAVCAEGEWHTLPLRLMAATVEEAGAQVTVLGGSVPAAHLLRYLERAAPDAVALSCTLPPHLLGAGRSIRAAHDAGVPVIVGGPAFGPDDRRATAMGADAWAAAPEDVAAFARVPPPHPGPPVEVPLEAVLADAVDDTALERALAYLVEDMPSFGSMNVAARSPTVEDLRWIVRYAAAAHACVDPRILADLLRWMSGLPAIAALPRGTVPASCRALAGVLADEAPWVTRLLLSAAEEIGISA